jgi:hypothetical protein
LQVKYDVSYRDVDLQPVYATLAAKQLALDAALASLKSMRARQYVLMPGPKSAAVSK